MSRARDEILSRVRAAVSDVEPSRWEDIPRRYPQSGTLDAEGRVELFEDRLKDYGATVYRCSEAGLPEAVADAMTARGKAALIVPAGLPKEWLPSRHQFPVDCNLSYDELDGCEGVITGSLLGIAITGTIVLRHTAADGRRALTLVPDYHLCVVFEDRIVETVPEGVRWMARYAGEPLTTISGPSATSDIEMIRVKGVHGPRSLDVILATHVS